MIAIQSKLMHVAAKIYQALDNFFPREGRWYLFGSHLTLVFIAWQFYGLQRTTEQIALAYVAAILVEYVGFRLTTKYTGRSFWKDRAFSAASEAAGLLVLVRASGTETYAIMAAIAVANKYLFRIDDKRHAFNPTNFAIVLGLLIFPKTIFDVRSDEFALHLHPILHVVAFGVLATWRGNSWVITLSYFAMLALGSAILPSISGESFLYHFAPEIGAIGMVFAWLMITDPRTTPRERSWQILFGASVAAVMLVLRLGEVFYAEFIALFIVTTIRTIWLLRVPELRSS